ncbi:16S rRNA (cytidine(1402)-2'-O)-methyltransferase, partial [Micromonospora zhanjiangensis]
MGEMSDTGRLVLLGAPLGNPGDASSRLRDVLASADVVAAEDTRRLTRLARDLDVTVAGRIVSYFEGNEERRTPDLVDALRDGALVALVTDGGMPSVSDPGYRLVRAALDAGVPVTAAPGPSAVTTALALSGLPCDRFCFEGFLPRSGGARRTRLR